MTPRIPILRIGLAFDDGILSGTRLGTSLRGLHLLLFPELVDGGYAALARNAGCHVRNDAFLQRFSDASERYSLCCVAGSVCLRDGASGRTNTSFAFTRGRMVHRFDKIHLFGPAGDTRYFRPGRTIRTFSIPHDSGRIRAGVIICYDLRFPELVRRMSRRGIKLLLVPARWPRVRDDAWYTLLKARAIENQIFVVGCNALGKEGGHSYVFGPGGRLLYSNKRAYNRLFHECVLDLRELDSVRMLHNNIRDAVLLKK